MVKYISVAKNTEGNSINELEYHDNLFTLMFGKTNYSKKLIQNLEKFWQE